MTIRTFEHRSPQVDNSVFVDESAVIIGKVYIQAKSSIWPFALIRGDIHDISIGEKTNIQDHCTLHVTHAGIYNPEGFPLIIGNEVTVGHAAVLHGCTIADRVLVGMGAIVMDNARVESDVIISAGSLVPPGKILQSGKLYVGRPCTALRDLTEKEYAYLQYSANYYHELANRHQT